MNKENSLQGEADIEAPQATYTIMSMMKDEGHCLIEWVAYHTHIGFDNICVYTNNCNDGTDAMLMRLEEMGYCKHFRNDVPEGKKPQPNALSLAEKNPAVTNSRWVLTMDADEFVSIKCGRGKIWDLVEAVPEDTNAIAITWRFFGSSELTDWNPGLVIENYRNAAPDKFRKGWGVKTLFRPFREMKLGIHRPHMKKAKQIPERAQEMMKQKWVNGSGEPMPTDFNFSGWRSTKPTLGYKLVELKDRVGMLRQTGEYDQWLAELKAASQIPIDRLNEVLFTQHLPKIWQEKVREMQEAGVPPKEIAKLINASQTAKKAETREAMRAAAEGREVASEKKTSAEAAEEFELSTEMKVIIAQKIREGHAEVARAKEAEALKGEGRGKDKAPPTLVAAEGAPTKMSRPGAEAVTPPEAGARTSRSRRAKPHPANAEIPPSSKIGSES
jgi:hypothetical protein